MPTPTPKAERDWETLAKEYAKTYGLAADDVESEVKRQLVQKLAEGIVKKVTAGKGGLAW